MIDEDKIEFINVNGYVEELKLFIENLYVHKGIVMSTAARNDLARINRKEFIANFTLAALAQWQQGNMLLGIRTYTDYVNTGSLVAEDIINSDVPAIQQAFNPDELQLVGAALSHWDSFVNLFYDRIENLDTLKIMLRNGERQRAINLGRETTLEGNDLVAFHNDKMKRLCDYLAERIRTLETISPVISGDVIEQSLRTSLSLEEFRAIVNHLVDARYVAGEFKTNSALTEQFYFYALHTGNEITARKCELKWISTTISLAQFVMTLIKAEAIHYTDLENAALYQWVHRCFSYEGSPKTLEADIRRALTVTVQSFSVKNKPGQTVQLVVNHIGRIPKGK